MTLWMAATLSSSTAALAFNRKPYSDHFGVFTNQPFCQPAGSATGWGFFAVDAPRKANADQRGIDRIEIGEETFA